MTAFANISITSTFSLPPLATVLKLPTTLDGVSVSVLASVVSKGSSDLSKLILDLKDHQWRDAAELTADDALYAAGVVGVPGAAVAATIVPYIFDSINVAVDSHGKVTAAQFIAELVHSQSNLDQIAVDISKRDWMDVANLTLDDVLDAASTFGAGPTATLAKAAINIAFAVAKSGGEKTVFLDLFSGIDQFVSDAKALPGVIVGELHGVDVKSADGKEEFNPFEGWVPVKN